jgi:hypothetical protein
MEVRSVVAHHKIRSRTLGAAWIVDFRCWAMNRGQERGGCVSFNITLDTGCEDKYLPCMQILCLHVDARAPSSAWMEMPPSA